MIRPASIHPHWHFDDAEVPHIVTPLPGPVARGMLERDTKFVSPSYTRVYPLVVARGSGAVIEDVDGNRFLDFTAGIAVNATGHCHPTVVDAIKDQADTLLHMSGTDFYYQPQIDLAQRLAEAGPWKGNRRVFFANSGAEAVEAALKLARHHTGRSHVIAFYGSFHGRTYGAMSLSASKLPHRRRLCRLCRGYTMWRIRVTAPVVKTAALCVRQIEDTVLHRTASPEEVAAIFVEPVQGEGGYHVPPAGFFPELRKLCDRHGILLVVDEVQSGMGRTGKMFAIEHWGVKPDIICLAKGIASGMPLGAIVADEDIMDWPPGSHASTFGGNPVSCRAALATMDLLEAGYMDNATLRGAELKEGLRKLQRTHPQLGDVRGLGLMVAVDVVHQRQPYSHDPRGRDALVHAAYENGLLLLGCGESAIRFCPPLCITSQQVQQALGILDAVLSGVAVG